MFLHILSVILENVVPYKIEIPSECCLIIRIASVYTSIRVIAIRVSLKLRRYYTTDALFPPLCVNTYSITVSFAAGFDLIRGYVAWIILLMCQCHGHHIADSKKCMYGASAKCYVFIDDENWRLASSAKQRDGNTPVASKPTRLG